MLQLAPVALKEMHYGSSGHHLKHNVQVRDAMPFA